jgi:hypothetical protein
MSVGVSIISVENGTLAPEIGDQGSLGYAELESERRYNKEWDVSAYSFGWIYSGLSSIGLITKEVENFKEFLSINRDKNIATFVEGEDDQDEVDIDWDNLQRFEASEKSEFKQCKYRIVNMKTNESFESDIPAMLVPVQKELKKGDVKNFVKKIVEAEDIDDAFTNTFGLLDVYGELGEIRKFVSQNKKGKLFISITEV